MRALLRLLVFPLILAFALVVSGQATAYAGENEARRVLRYIEAEERAARDLFTAFDAVHDSPALTRIAERERVHARAMRALVGRSSGDARGEFGDYAGLQQDYSLWLSRGLRDLHSAAEVGIAVERQHLAVMDAAIAAPIRADVRRILREIRRDDIAHLKAFERMAAGTEPAPPCGVIQC